ncbi:hypothetical protein POLEWNIK_00440 [Brevundimonas phage vB_BpoS-Polewnik]|nr:hypothetical protein POLEWNIK_00440 [Brevundimonas phage vB_BpoS-Polewnik]
MSGAAVSGLIAGATLDQVNEALKSAPTIMDPRLPEGLAKSTFAQSGSATSGLTYYDLEAGAKFLYPVLTPLRNEIPRVSGKGGIQANWRAITGINTSGVRIGVSGGNRGAVVAISTADYTAAYKGIGIEDNVDFEAQYAGQGFEDIRAIAAKVGLEALMLGEELLLLGGNGSLALGTTPTASLSGSATGGTLPDSTVHVSVVALTLEGFVNSSIVSGIPTAITRTNADGSTDTFGGGSAQKSASASVVLSGGGTAQSITATCAPVRGAVGYAWFWGASAAGATLGAVTGGAKVVITTPTGAGTQTYSSLPSTDNSVNNLVFDGLLTQAMKPGSNAYWKDLGGAPLSTDGAGGIVQFDAALKDRWDNYRLSFDTIWVSSAEALSISQLILQGNANGAYRIVFNPEQGMIAGGIMVATYLNRFSMAGAQTLKVRIHPNMPSGTVLFTTSRLPYPLSNVNNVMQVRTRQDYYQIEWPLVTRKYEYGVYADEVLQHYFPPALGVLTGIGTYTPPGA